MSIRLGTFFVLTFVLTACASIPSASLLDASLLKETPGSHLLTVERGSNVGANRAPLNVYVNDKLTAQLYGNQAVDMYLPEGRYRIGVAMNNVGVFGHGERGPDRAITVDVSETSKPILRASPVGGTLPVWGIKRVN